MMAKIDQQLKDDRTLRDAANALLKADMAILRDSLTPQNMAARVKERGESLSVKALAMADRNQGALATGGAAIAALAALFFARKPISAKLSALLGPAPENDKALLPPAADDAARHSEDDEILRIGQ